LNGNIGVSNISIALARLRHTLPIALYSNVTRGGVSSGGIGVMAGGAADRVRSGGTLGDGGGTRKRGERHHLVRCKSSENTSARLAVAARKALGGGVSRSGRAARSNNASASRAAKK